MKKVIDILSSVISLLIPQFKKADSKESIKETREALIGINEIALFMAEKLKDGAQFSDAIDFYNKITVDESFKKVIKEAYEGYGKISGEVKDIDLGEGLELGMVQIEYLPKFVEALKKEEVKS